MSPSIKQPATVVRFGSDRSNHLAIVARHAYPETADPGDRDSLDAQLELAAGDFRASFQVWFPVANLARLRDDLTQLYDNLNSTVVLAAWEEQLQVRFVGNGRGRIVLSGTASDRPGSSNRLDFRFELDQTELLEARLALEELLRPDGERWAELCSGTARTGERQV